MKTKELLALLGDMIHGFERDHQTVQVAIQKRRLDYTRQDLKLLTGLNASVLDWMSHRRHVHATMFEDISRASKEIDECATHTYLAHNQPGEQHPTLAMCFAINAATSLETAMIKGWAADRKRRQTIRKDAK
jgi:hypothetical protein